MPFDRSLIVSVRVERVHIVHASRTCKRTQELRRVTTKGDHSAFGPGEEASFSAER